MKPVTLELFQPGGIFTHGFHLEISSSYFLLTILFTQPFKSSKHKFHLVSIFTWTALHYGDGYTLGSTKQPMSSW